MNIVFIGVFYEASMQPSRTSGIDAALQALEYRNERLVPMGIVLISFPAQIGV